MTHRLVMLALNFELLAFVGYTSKISESHMNNHILIVKFSDLGKFYSNIPMSLLQNIQRHLQFLLCHFASLSLFKTFQSNITHTYTMIYSVYTHFYGDITCKSNVLICNTLHNI